MVQRCTKDVVVTQHWHSCGNECVPVMHALWCFCGPERSAGIYRRTFYKTSGVLYIRIGLVCSDCQTVKKISRNVYVCVCVYRVHWYKKFGLFFLRLFQFVSNISIFDFSWARKLDFSKLNCHVNTYKRTTLSHRWLTSPLSNIYNKHEEPYLSDLKLRYKVQVVRTKGGGGPPFGGGEGVRGFQW